MNVCLALVDFLFRVVRLIFGAPWGSRPWNGGDGEMKRFRKAINFTTMCVFFCGSVFLLTACGGGGGSSDEGTITGTFLDTAVDGLTYTANPSGITGTTQNGGKFDCNPSDTVDFYVGDVNLGQTPCQEIVSPIDLVTGATDVTDPVVTNIARFLQSLDSDQDLSNGIDIDSDTAAEVTGRGIDITNPDLDFDNDADIQNLFSSLGVTPVSAIEAQNHCRSTLLDLLSGTYSGTYTGHDSGTWSIVADATGNVTGTGFSNGDNLYFEVTGTVSSAGAGIFIASIAGEVATFSGSISYSGNVSGDWEITSLDMNGTFTGSRSNTPGGGDCIECCECTVAGHFTDYRGGFTATVLITITTGEGSCLDDPGIYEGKCENECWNAAWDIGLDSTPTEFTFGECVP